MIKKKFNVSLMVLTKNRPKLLKICLSSIFKQTYLPKEIIVVDGSLVNKSRLVVKSFQNNRKVKVIYSWLPNSPIEAARDKAVDLAINDLLVFLDDDLSARKNYLAEFVNFFQQHPKAVAVMGKTQNGLENNIFASVQHSFYRRWLLSHFSNLQTLQRLPNGMVLDREVAGFRRQFIKQFKWFKQVPPGYRNEDVELGVKMLAKNREIYFNPRIVADAYLRTSFQAFCQTAFLIGFSDQFTQNRRKIDVDSLSHQPKLWEWYKQEIMRQQSPKQLYLIIFFLVFYLFPLLSRLGRIYGKIKNF